MTVGRHLVHYARPYRRQFAAALGQTLLIAGLDLLKPWPLQIIVDHVLVRPPAAWHGLPATTLVALACGAVVLLQLVSGSLTIAYNWQAIGLGQRMVADLRSALYARLQRLSLSYHGRQRVGDLMLRLTGDSYAVQTLMMNGVLPILSAAALLAGMLVVLARLDALLAIVAALIVPVLFVAIALFNRRIGVAATSARDTESLVYSVAQWGVAAIRHVQAFTRESAEHRRFMSASDAALDAHRLLYAWQTGYAAAIGVLMAGGTALVVFVGAHEVLAATITVGQLLVFVAYLAQLYGPVNQITQGWGLIAGARVGAARCIEVLETEPDLPDGSRVFPDKGAAGRVEWRSVRFGYGPDTPILHGIDLVVEPGETVAIVGSTGAGKSTMLSLLPRFADPASGQVLIDGVDVRDYRIEAIRRQIAMVLQPPLILPGTVALNIAYGRPDATEAEIEAAAHAAAIDDLVQRLPLGYQTIVGEAGVDLSEGEKQRLTIARALLRGGSILLLDEPTSALDVTTESQVMAGIDRLARGRTTLMIAHRLSTARRADRIVVLKDGRIAETGSFAELMQRGEIFATLHNAQFATAEEDRVGV